MKKIILLLSITFLLLVGCLSTEPITVEPYKMTIQAPGASVEELVVKINQWLVSIDLGLKDEYQFHNSERGDISLKGNKYTRLDNIGIAFTSFMNFEVKEGLVNLNFYLVERYGDEGYRTNYRFYVDEYDIEIMHHEWNQIGDDLKLFINNSTKW